MSDASWHYLCSNAKDQKVKLWDLRTGTQWMFGWTSLVTIVQCTSAPVNVVDYHTKHQAAPCNPAWDYRSQPYPGNPLLDCYTHPHDKYKFWTFSKTTVPHLDRSLYTFVGHKVHRTLIRARMSPMRTTGGRYSLNSISWCSDGYLLPVHPFRQCQRHHTYMGPAEPFSFWQNVSSCGASTVRAFTSEFQLPSDGGAAHRWGHGDWRQRQSERRRRLV